MPERKQKHPVLRKAKILAGLHQFRRQRASLEVRLSAQQRKRQLSHLDPVHVVAG